MVVSRVTRCSARKSFRVCDRSSGQHIKGACNIDYMHVCIRYNTARMRRNLFTHAWQVRRSWPPIAATIALAASSGLAQVTAPETLTPLPSAQSVIQRNTDPYAGSIPQGTVSPEPIDLSLSDALDRGLKYNLGLSYVNPFWVVSMIVACLVPLPFLMRKPRPGEAPAAGAH